MGVNLYCGVSETKWNRYPVTPGPYACVSPVYGKTLATKRETPTKVPTSTLVLQDSGAFSDGPGQRLNFEAALERQLAHADKWGYAEQVQYRASYDLLIDEVWTGGNRHKRRWSVTDAESAVSETVRAAEWLSRHRPDSKGLVLSAQGVDAPQYLKCVEQVLPHMDMARDVLGLGGWCIIGKMPAVMMPVFRETIKRVIPYAAQGGVTRVHIWGVIYAPALGELLWMCDQYGMALSTDSAGPNWRPAFGMWGYANWKNPQYQRAPVETRGLHRALHVQVTRCWLKHLSRSRYYRSPLSKPYRHSAVRKSSPFQPSLFALEAA